MHTSSSSHVGPREAGRGFSLIDMDLAKRVGIHSSAKMPQVFNRTIIPFLEQRLATMTKLSDKQRADILTAAHTMRDLFDTQDDNARQTVSFKDGNGYVAIFTFGYGPVAPDSDKYRWFVIDQRGEFALMPDYVVVRHTKSNFFSSTSHDEIKYLSRGVTTADMAALVQQMVVVQAGVAQMLLPAA